MKRGHDHPSPHGNGKGNSSSHYSTVVTTPFTAHIECPIPPDSAPLCVTPRFDCGIHYFTILDLCRVKNRVERLSFVVEETVHTNGTQSSFDVYTDVIVLER